MERDARWSARCSFRPRTPWVGRAEQPSLLHRPREAEFGVGHVAACRPPGLSQAWLHEWRDGHGPRRRPRRRVSVALGLVALFSLQHRGRLTVLEDQLRTCGSLGGRRVIPVAAAMREQGGWRRGSAPGGVEIDDPGRQGSFGGGIRAGLDFAAEGMDQKNGTGWDGESVWAATRDSGFRCWMWGSRRIVGLPLPEYDDAEQADRLIVDGAVFVSCCGQVGGSGPGHRRW